MLHVTCAVCHCYSIVADVVVVDVVVADVFVPYRVQVSAQICENIYQVYNRTVIVHEGGLYMSNECEYSYFQYAASYTCSK